MVGQLACRQAITRRDVSTVVQWVAVDGAGLFPLGS